MTKHLHMVTPSSEAPKRTNPGLPWVLFALFVACAGSFGFIGVNPGGAPLGQIGQALADAWRQDMSETRDLMARHLLLRPNS